MKKCNMTMLPFLIHWKDHPIKLFSYNPVMHHFQSTTTWSPYKIGYPNSRSPDNNSTGNVIFYGWLLLISLINDALLQMLHGEFGRLQMLHSSICIKLLSELRIQGYDTYMIVTSSMIQSSDVASEPICAWLEKIVSI